jgi:ABC-type antimicrobial peptide transport system ATPase subunit
MEGNGGSLEDGAEAFVLFLRSAQLVLRSSVLTVLGLDEVNVTLNNAEIFGLVLFGESGYANGWRSC